VGVHVNRDAPQLEVGSVVHPLSASISRCENRFRGESRPMLAADARRSNRGGCPPCRDPAVVAVRRRPGRRRDDPSRVDAGSLRAGDGRVGAPKAGSLADVPGPDPTVRLEAAWAASSTSARGGWVLPLRGEGNRLDVSPDRLIVEVQTTRQR
jgi:hypothetical protein